MISHHGPWGSLTQFMDYALASAGSAFTVGEVEKVAPKYFFGGAAS